MDVAALITWIIAALGGFYLLATWLRNGGTRQQGGPSRFPTGLIFGHFALAAAGLVVWLIYVFNESDGLAWTGFVLVVLTALLGFAMFARWLQGRQSGGGAVTPSTSGEVAAEQTFPLAAVLGHGAIAAVTVVFVLIAALT